MKFISKTVAAVLLFILITGSLTAVAGEFTDLPGDYWAGREISGMQNLGIIVGAPNGKFNPESPVTRAEFATMIAKGLKLPVQTSGKSRFIDVQKGYWAMGFIEAVAGAGFINGYQGKFRPAENISRQEMAVVVMKISEKYGYPYDGSVDTMIRYKDGQDVAAWAAPFFAGALKFGYITNVKDPNTVTESVYSTSWFKRELKPASNATRAEAAFALYKLMIKTGLI